MMTALKTPSLALAPALLGLCGFAVPAAAQTTAPQDALAPAPTPDATPAPADGAVPATSATDAQQNAGPQTDILSKNTVAVILDARLIAADGERSFTDGGLGKTRFSGAANGDFKARALPMEADLLWMPRFTSSLSGNVSAAWQRSQENSFDLIEAFLTWLPNRGSKVSFSAKAGLYWPEISLEHATGGAWSTVYTLTPSAINSWVGEETKVLGGEGTVTLSLGQHEVSATGGVFGFNDTSGTLLSFRGWALHDLKATAFGHFDLPPLNSFITQLQQGETRSLVEIDHRAGFYGRLEWRPPTPFTLSAFYYDNRGNPQAFFPSGQWGWRTRFLNVGLSADLGSNTRFLAQAMTGATQMGFKTGGVLWVHTRFQSAYALITRQFGKVALTGRIEGFATQEHGSEMSPLDSEQGRAVTVAGRWYVTNNLTAFVEGLHVTSNRGVRLTELGIPAFQAQTVFQAGLRFKLW